MRKEFKKRVIAIVEKTPTGFSAYAIDYSFFTTGETISALHTNLVEAGNLYFEYEGYFISQKNIQLEIDLKQFFQYYRVLNAKFLAERIGINPTLLSQYVQGRKKPSEKQKEKIMNGIREIGKELSEINIF